MLTEFNDLAAASALFVGGHFLMSATPIRNRLIGMLGRYSFLALYSIVALVAFGWMLWSYRLAPYLWIWGSPEWARMIVFTVMPLSAMLVTAGYLTANPSAAFGDYVLRRDDPAPGIFKITRHPVLLGFALWAASHLLANGNVAGILLFGSLLILSIGGIAHIETRRRASDDPAWRRFIAVTSILPFAAVIAGRARLNFTPMDWTRLALGLGLYALLLQIHGWAFGVYLVGKP